MLRALRTDVVRVNLTLMAGDPDDGSSQVLDYKGGKYVASPNTMLYLRVEVSNTTRSLFTMIFLLQLAKIIDSVTARDDIECDG